MLTDSISSNLLLRPSILLSHSCNLTKRHYLRRFLVLCSVACLFGTLVTVFDRRENDEEWRIESPPTHLFEPNTSTAVPLPATVSRMYHVVLLWTDLFNEIYWHQKAFFNTSIVVACSSQHFCQFTRDRRRLPQSALVAFHLYDIDRNRLPERVPSTSNNQSWVFVTGESPVNFYYQNPSFFPRMLDDYFDRSISYKYDSPYPIFTASMQISNRSWSDNSEEQRNNRSLQYKRKPIVWIVSNCITFSQREKYVEELKQYIQIDIYGKCGTTCSEASGRSCNIDLGEYYFYLAFENSRCNSYITEKFWNVISDATHRLVPIVMGAPEPDYRRIAPRQSYIHVDEYPSPKDLAQYLHELIGDARKYLAYLRWRTEYEIERPSAQKWENLLCPLCQMANEAPSSSKSRIRFSTWYQPKVECHSDDVKTLKQCKQTNLRDWMSWTHNIKCP